jgi:starch phosphorylase
MKNFQTYQVFPNIPISLEFLEELSRNLWWCWKKDAIELFRRIDPTLWVACERNPIAFLAKVTQHRFEQLAEDEGYLAHLERVKKEFQKRVLDPVNQDENPYGPDDTIAYFSIWDFP